MRRQVRQTQPCSCGAAALLCAAMELEIEKLPDVSPWMGMALDDPRAEHNVFQYTGSGTPATPDRDRGYSMPARLAMVARNLGLRNPTVYMAPGITTWLLNTFYGQARQEARSSDLPVVARVMPPLMPWQRALRIVSLMKVPALLHYVMERPDGSFMDPADGQDYTSFEALRAPLSKSYGDTGIVLVVDSEWASLQPLV